MALSRGRTNSHELSDGMEAIQPFIPAVSLLAAGGGGDTTEHW